MVAKTRDLRPRRQFAIALAAKHSKKDARRRVGRRRRAQTVGGCARARSLVHSRRSRVLKSKQTATAAAAAAAAAAMASVAATA